MGESVREPSAAFRCPPQLEATCNFRWKRRSVGTVTFDSSGSLFVVFVTAGSVRLHGNLLVDTPPMIGSSRSKGLSVPKDHVPGCCCWITSRKLCALLDVKEQFGFSIREAGPD